MRRNKKEKHALRSLPAALIVAALLLPAAALAEEAHRPARLVTVSGEGEMRAAPDKADIAVTVYAEHKESAKAKKEADRKLIAAKGIFRELGIEEKWVHTQGYSIQPRFTYVDNASDIGKMLAGQAAPRRRQALEAYEASYALSVELRETEKAGALVEKLVAAGIDRVGGISYGLKEEEALRREALAKAVAEAKRKAQAVAESAGAKLGRVVAISESGGYARPQIVDAGAAMMAEAKAAAAPSPPSGEIEIRASVQAVFALE